MKKLKPFSVKSITLLSSEEMTCINGGSDDRYYTSCSMENIGQKCVYGEKSGVCDYYETRDSSGNVLYYDTYCKV